MDIKLKDIKILLLYTYDILHLNLLQDQKIFTSKVYVELFCVNDKCTKFVMMFLLIHVIQSDIQCHIKIRPLN